jgi:hypothetical protein
MGRKKRKDRRGVARHVVTIRLDDREREGLEELVRTQNAKLREMRMPAVVTRASYLRSLIHRELESLGMRSSGGAEGSLEPESLVLLPPRKKLRKTIKKMPGDITIERSLTKPKTEVEVPKRLTVWERLRINNFEDDET